jgi:hypothetical protein
MPEKCGFRLILSLAHRASLELNTAPVSLPRNIVWVAQSVEQWTENPRVVSSILTPDTENTRLSCCAQGTLGAHKAVNAAQQSGVPDAHSRDNTACR